MKTDFDKLRLNNKHQVDTNINGDKQVVKINALGEIIAKKVKLKKSIRYFVMTNYQDHLTDEITKD